MRCFVHFPHNFFFFEFAFSRTTDRLSQLRSGLNDHPGQGLTPQESQKFLEDFLADARVTDYSLTLYGYVFISKNGIDFFVFSLSGSGIGAGKLRRRIPTLMHWDPRI